MTMQKWGGIASFLLAGSFLAPLIYLLLGPPDGGGPSLYDLADFLYGPVWAASLVTMVFVLRERTGEDAPRLMTLALLAAFLAAGAMVSVACMRSANRAYLEYLRMRPDIDPSVSVTLLMSWTPLVSSIIAMGRHFMGWSLVLIGSAGWTSRTLPRGLSLLYLLSGAASLFLYRLDIDPPVMMLCMVASIWQGILLWNDRPGERQAAKPIRPQLEHI
jgi:hypothetical protein